MSLPPATNCADCCACPTPVLRWETRSATRSKNGWIDYDYETNFKYYKKHVWTGSIRITCDWYPGETWQCYTDDYATYSGESVYDPIANTITYGAQKVAGTCTYGSESFCGADTCDDSTATTYDSKPLGNFPSLSPPGSADVTYPNPQTVLYTPPEDGGCSPTFYAGGSATGTATASVSDEYTTANLITYTLADLPGDYPLTTAGSSRNLSDTEISFSVREGRYYWRFPVPNNGYGRRYVIQWVERFQPEDEEAAPTDTIRCEEWDGIVPEGYDPEDPETWPELGPYDAAIPETDGLFDVGQYTDPEDPDTYVSGGFLVACKGACP